MKKTVSLVLALIMLLSLCACGGGNVTETEPAETRETLELQEETEPVEEEQIESKSWIGLVLIAGTLTFLLGGALIVRIMSRKGRY